MERHMVVLPSKQGDCEPDRCNVSRVVLPAAGASGGTQNIDLSNTCSCG